MYRFHFNENSKNFRSRFKAHLKRCRLFYEAGGTLWNSVDYGFSKHGKYSNNNPNLDVDFNIKNGVSYRMVIK